MSDPPAPGERPEEPIIAPPPSEPVPVPSEPLITPPGDEPLTDDSPGNTPSPQPATGNLTPPHALEVAASAAALSVR